MDKRLEQAILNLQTALKELDGASSPVVANAAVSKCFEVALEYAWKFFKRQAEDSGVEVFSPKDAVRAAAASRLVDDPELWIRFINNRNLSVHDYLGVDDKEYLNAVREFLAECNRLKGRW